jgi:hypothetical protein
MLYFKVQSPENSGTIGKARYLGVYIPGPPATRDKFSPPLTDDSGARSLRRKNTVELVFVNVLEWKKILSPFPRSLCPRIGLGN